MTQIERRQARMRRIRAKFQKAGKTIDEDVATSPEAHHVIGISQNFPEHIPMFLHKNREDPAIKVMSLDITESSLLRWFIGQDFVPKLKRHILPRIRQILYQESAEGEADSNSPRAGLSAISELCADDNSILFKGDRIYRHNLGRFNYTTYDVRRSQDVINPGTTHRDIMVLASNPDSDSESNHRFLYARVLGIYHVNVIYIGGGSADYTPRRVEFLWVRWFDYDNNVQTDFKLDPIRFPPMAYEGAFDFVDPNNVVRGCHIVPAFARGKARADGIGLSRLAGDSEDWSEYRVNRYVLFHYLNLNPGINFRAAPRFVDRDMVMRFHWGLAAGHVYTHPVRNISQTQPSVSTTHDEDTIRDLESDMTSGNPADLLEQEDDAPDLDNPEFSLENHEDDLFDEEDDFEDEQELGDDEHLFLAYR
jgi:hypothetical protein